MELRTDDGLGRSDVVIFTPSGTHAVEVQLSSINKEDIERRDSIYRSQHRSVSWLYDPSKVKPPRSVSALPIRLEFDDSPSETSVFIGSGVKALPLSLLRIEDRLGPQFDPYSKPIAPEFPFVHASDARNEKL